MNLVIIPHNVTLTDAIEKHLISRINKIEHLNNYVTTIRATLEHDQAKAPDRAFCCSMKLSLPGPDIFAEDVEADLYAAMDLVVKKIEQQLRKRHGKRKTRSHKIAARTKRTRQEAGI
jgi:putative sigma-54 modulation protein